MATEDDDTSSTEGLTPVNPAAPVTITEQTDQDDGGDDDDADQQQAQPTRDQRGRWAGKKDARDRGRSNLRQKLAELEGQNRQFQDRLSQMLESSRAERQQMLQAIIASRQGGPAQQQPSQAEQQISSLQDAIAAELDLLSKDTAHSPKRYNELQSQLRRAEWAAWNAEQQRNQPSQRDQQTADPQAVLWQTMMESEFPWIAGNESAMRAAAHERRKLMAMGRPNTIETLRLAIATIGEQMNLGGGRRPPSEQQRRAFAGAPGGSGRGNGAPKSVTVPDSRMLRGTGLSQAALNSALLSDD